MMRITWWKKPGAERKLQGQRQRRIRPAIEELESRIVPSVTGFRPIDEVGNNPNNLGTAGTDLLRISLPAYGNGINTPSMGGIASPRTVSNDVSNQATTLFGPTDLNTVDQNGLSDFGYVFGQFLDHDMDLTPDQTGQPAPNPNPTKDGNNGFPIPASVNPGDPITNLTFSRSVFDPATGTSTAREQINAVTSYLDLSQVYGSTDAVANALRTFSGGLLKTSPGADGIIGTADDLLPYNSPAYFSPTAADPDPNQLAELNMANDAHLVDPSQLFAAGDVRANENVELTALQTLFVRNHNAIATQLATMNPADFGFTSWTDENLYQEARKLNIAQYQNIIYTQYLPDLLGPNAMPAYTGYNLKTNPSIATEFSTVAFRFGHSLLNNDVRRDNTNGSPIGSTTLQLAQDFFDPNLLAPGGVVDPFTGLVSTDIGAVLKGDADGTAQASDVMAVNSVRNLLFGDGSGGGQDLIARDIWRAHDDGIGTYNQVLAAFNLPTIPFDPTDPLHGFEYITSDPTVQQELITAYGSKAGFFNTKGAGDIDPFIAGLAEDHVPGSDLGPLFTKILTDQFSRLETGDQYFYLNESFTPAEQSILNQGSTLGQIITSNTGVTNLQSDVFRHLSQENGVGKGFYTNKNCQVALTGSQTGTMLTPSLYNALVAALDPNNTGFLALVDANGNPLADTFLLSYGNVQSYLKNSKGSMANKLSVQLLTTEISIALGKIDATTSIFVPAVTFVGTSQTLSSTVQNSLMTNGVSNPSGIAKIEALLNASIAVLQSGSSDATFAEALKDSLDGINNNETIFIL